MSFNRFRTARRLPAILTVIVVSAVTGATMALASSVDVAVVDVTVPTNTVTLTPGNSSPIQINMSVAGNQAGTATFEVDRNWTLSGGTWTGSNPQEFTVGPRGGGDPATTFSTSGTVSVASGQSAGTFNLEVGAFDITNTNATGAKLGAGSSSTYQVVVGSAGPTDTSAPIVVPTVVGQLGDNGWYTGDVAVSFSVNDLESSITSQSAGCAGGSVTADTTGLTFECVASSAGGTSSASVTIKRDATNPVIVRNPAADSCSVPGTNGWCRGEQTAGFAASDAMSGLANGEDSPWAFTKSSSTNGNAVSISSGTIEDAAGNSATEIGAGPFKIDSANPTIAGAATPVPNANGWNNTNVFVDFTCGDGGGSVIVLCGPDTTLASEGRDLAVAGTATDEAGNSDSTSVGGIDIDKTAPSAPAATTNPASAVVNSGGWFKDTVTVSYGGSVDPDLTDGSDGSGIQGHSPNQTFSTSGTHAYSGAATDIAGNESAATSGSVKVDATIPVVSITAGCPVGPVTLGSAQAIAVTASDAHSGLASDPSGTIALDTATVGSKVKTVSVEDKVGHPASVTCSYSVVYNWSGFFQPIDNGGVFNVVNAGRTIPAKFSLGGDQGMYILATGSPSSAPVPCPSAATFDGVEETTTTTSGLKYDPIANQYIYNWKTLTSYAGTCRQLTVKLIDDTTHTALFKFVK